MRMLATMMNTCNNETNEDDRWRDSALDDGKFNKRKGPIELPREKKLTRRGQIAKLKYNRSKKDS